ncbi:MAG: AAA family ATPase [Ruminiclostridium sp.]
MALIKLLILDDDDEYSFNLCNYLTHNYSEALLVNYYNISYKIEEWIKKIDPDIILICEKYYNQVSNYFKKNLIILTTGTNSVGLSDVSFIYKYKDANQIVGDIINIFTKAGNIITQTKDKITKTVAIYSAAGNVGKTSVAMGISTICSYLGLSVFYLNLEQFQSTSIFFSNNIEYSISDIIYYAKENDKNLISKISTMSCKDAVSNVHYFKEPNNAFDIDELLPQDIKFIVDTMKECGQYDLIVIDMGSQLNENNISLFQIADEIIYIFTDEEICLHKTKIFIDSINMLSNRFVHNTFLAHKFLYVANKVSKQALQSEKSRFNQEILSKIPYDPNFTSVRSLIKPNGGPELINNALKDIARRYIS